jgi:hypothetical protein
MENSLWIWIHCFNLQTQKMKTRPVCPPGTRTISHHCWHHSGHLNMVFEICPILFDKKFVFWPETSKSRLCLQKGNRALKQRDGPIGPELCSDCRWVFGASFFMMANQTIEVRWDEIFTKFGMPEPRQDIMTENIPFNHGSIFQVKKSPNPEPKTAEKNSRFARCRDDRTSQKRRVHA